MSNIQITSIGILIPFLGTTVGAALVFLLKNKMTSIIEKILLGFASGVMIAASIWSLLIPAINMAEGQDKITWIPATIGFLLGIASLMFFDQKAEELERKKENCKGKDDSIKEKVKSTTMLILAVTLHNIPEGIFQSRQYA